MKHRSVITAADLMPNEMSPDIIAARWGLVAQTLIGYRKHLNWLAGDECPYKNLPQHKDCYRRAARLLGPAISEAVNEQRKLRELLTAAYPPPVIPDPPTDEQLTDLGNEIAADPTAAGMKRQGRPLTNLEMAATLEHGREEQRQAIERDGCCGCTPMSDGFCFGVGLCPREAEIQRCNDFCERYLQWLEEINQPVFEEIPAFAE